MPAVGDPRCLHGSRRSVRAPGASSATTADSCTTPAPSPPPAGRLLRRSARPPRSADGSLPALSGPPLQPYDSVSTLTLPADNGTWGVGLIVSARDTVMRPCRDVGTWTEVINAFPLVAHWIDAEPISDVAVMAGIEDRQRDYVVDGAPAVTGLVAVGDAWACTNPSVGRGCSIGVVHAEALRDLVRAHDLDDETGFALAWDHTTRTQVEPFVGETLHFDRHRLAEIE